MSESDHPVLTEQEMLRKEMKIQAANTFGVYNHIRPVAVRQDYAEAALDIVPDSLNFHETVHGGAYFTMADICSGMVCRTDGRTYVTQQANAVYVRAIKAGTLTARGTVIHRGRTSCLVDIRITSEKNELAFMGTFLFHCIS